MAERVARELSPGREGRTDEATTFARDRCSARRALIDEMSRSHGWFAGEDIERIGVSARDPKILLAATTRSKLVTWRHLLPPPKRKM
jgi:hypothetical protein